MNMCVCVCRFYLIAFFVNGARVLRSRESATKRACERV